uniref:Uncharacterized protein n=1 Tax=Cyprinus carpio TaxID=7962 RepID=A0A8C1TA89_CYPCA
MPQTADPITHGEDVNTWLRGMTDSGAPKTSELLLFLIIILILRRFLTQDSSQNNNHEELVKITSSLSYAFTTQLKLSDKHITHLQEELTRAQRRIDKLEVKVQDQLKVPNEWEQETTEQVKKLQAALAAAQLNHQHATAAQKDLVSRLQYAEQLLEKTKNDIRDKNSEISALKDHLERYRTEMDNLTQQLDDTNDELYMVRKELQYAYEQKQEPRKEKLLLASSLLSTAESHIQELAYDERSEGAQPKTSPVFATQPFPANERKPPVQDLGAAHGMTIKDLNKLSENISRFNQNSTEGHDIQAYLQDIEFHMEMRPHVTDRDRLCILRATSSPEVRNFLDRQPSHTKSNYQRLCEVLIKEFTDPESEHGLLTALETKQGRQETPQAYYNRLRQAYFGAHNKPDLEEDVNFKSLFLKNLHPGVSHHLGVMACL